MKAFRAAAARGGPLAEAHQRRLLPVRHCYLHQSAALPVVQGHLQQRRQLHQLQCQQRQRHYHQHQHQHHYQQQQQHSFHDPPPIRFLSTVHGGGANSATLEDDLPPRTAKEDDGINKRMVLTLARHLWPNASTTERANELKGRVALR